MIKLLIEEEYGFRDWYAEFTEEEFEKLAARWKTLKGLNCLVPVTLIIPEAKELDQSRENEVEYTHRCHIHEEDDSYLQGVGYDIPETENFWMDGKEYQSSEYWPEYFPPASLTPEQDKALDKMYEELKGVSTEQFRELFDE